MVLINLKNNFYSILGLLILFFVSSCQQQEIEFSSQEEYISEVNGIINYMGVPYSGIIYEKFKYYNSVYSDQEKFYKYSFKEGKLDGTQEMYYTNFSVDYYFGLSIEGIVDNTLFYKATFKNGEINGPFEMFYPDGKLYSKGTIINDDWSEEYLIGSESVVKKLGYLNYLKPFKGRKNYNYMREISIFPAKTSGNFNFTDGSYEEYTNSNFVFPHQKK
tara:strand:+ start:197 stop:850 length:654 start_codon:yes stop_codon:yes gene_type:complete